MKEFACKNLGYDDNWKHVAKTQDLLTDIVAVHLREIHGVKEVTPELITKIRNSFKSPSPEDSAAAADLVLRQYNCSMDPECTWRYIAQTEELIAEGAAAHAREAHGVKEFTPEMMGKVKKASRECPDVFED